MCLRCMVLCNTSSIIRSSFEPMLKLTVKMHLLTIHTTVNEYYFFTKLELNTRMEILKHVEIGNTYISCPKKDDDFIHQQVPETLDFKFHNSSGL